MSTAIGHLCLFQLKCAFSQLKLDHFKVKFQIYVLQCWYVAGTGGPSYVLQLDELPGNAEPVQDPNTHGSVWSAVPEHTRDALGK